MKRSFHERRDLDLSRVEGPVSSDPPREIALNAALELADGLIPFDSESSVTLHDLHGLEVDVADVTRGHRQTVER